MIRGQIPETARIAFVETRDGIDGACLFARQTMKVYRNALLQTSRRGNARTHFATTQPFRETFIRSYLDLKRYLDKHGQLLR